MESLQVHSIGPFVHCSKVNGRWAFTLVGTHLHNRQGAYDALNSFDRLGHTFGGSPVFWGENRATQGHDASIGLRIDVNMTGFSACLELRTDPGAEGEVLKDCDPLGRRPELG